MARQQIRNHHPPGRGQHRGRAAILNANINLRMHCRMRRNQAIRQRLFNFTLAAENLRAEFQRLNFFGRQILATLGAGAVH